MSVPRIIHQTWKTETIPSRFRPFVDSVRDLHPGWDHRLWTDDDNRGLIERSFPWFLDTYDGYNHDIERADAARYFILLTHGGVYIDLDMEALRPIDEIVSPRGLTFSFEAGPAISDKVVSNAFMAAPPGHPFFHHVVEDLPGLCSDDVTFADVFSNTGPDMLARQVAKFATEYPIRLLGLDLVCPVGVLDQNPAITPPRDPASVRVRRAVHVIHHNTETWNVQRPQPRGEIPGYVLFVDHDLPGHDIAYVEVPEQSFDPIIAACDADPRAVGFNYNGFIKGPGARLEPVEAGAGWLKPGIASWVCVKREHLDAVR